MNFFCNVLIFKLGSAGWFFEGYAHQQSREPGQHVITALSPDALIELKHLIGKPLGISILHPDGSRRPVCGIVSRVRAKPRDGGFAQYEIELVPAFDLLKHTRNSHTFQTKSVPDIV